MGEYHTAQLDAKHQQFIQELSKKQMLIDQLSNSLKLGQNKQNVSYQNDEHNKNEYYQTLNFKNQEIIDLQSKIENLLEQLDLQEQKSENYQTGCKNASEQISKLVLNSQEQEDQILNFQNEISELSRD